MKKLALMLICSAVGGCMLTSTRVDNLEVIGVGIFTRHLIVDTPSGQHVIAGKYRLIGDPWLLRRTTTIPASLGTSFGIACKFVGSPRGGVIPITTEWSHPWITDPSTGNASNIDRVTEPYSIGAEHYIGYHFDYPWEVAPGDWRLRVFVGGRLFADQTFKVVATKRPNQALQPTATVPLPHETPWTHLL